MRSLRRLKSCPLFALVSYYASSRVTYAIFHACDECRDPIVSRLPPRLLSGLNAETQALQESITHRAGSDRPASYRSRDAVDATTPVGQPAKNIEGQP